MGRAVEDRETVIGEVLIPAELAASRARRPAKILEEAPRLLFVQQARQADVAPTAHPEAHTSPKRDAANGAGSLFMLKWREISIFTFQIIGLKDLLVCSVRMSMFVEGVAKHGTNMDEGLDW